jgi:hypothetical protein
MPRQRRWGKNLNGISSFSPTLVAVRKHLRRVIVKTKSKPQRGFMVDASTQSATKAAKAAAKAKTA